MLFVVAGFIMWLDAAAAAEANLLSPSLVHPVAINPRELLQFQHFAMIVTMRIPSPMQAKVFLPMGQF